MKLALLMAAAGYGLAKLTLDRRVQDLFLQQPVWLILTEAALCYVVGLRLLVVESAAQIASQYPGQGGPDGDDMEKAWAFSIFWPITLPAWFCVKLLNMICADAIRSRKPIRELASRRLQRIREKRRG